MSNLRYGVETIDILIESLQKTKRKLETVDLISESVYDTFELLSTIYTSMEQAFGQEELAMFQKEYVVEFVKQLKSTVNNEYIAYSIEVDEGFYMIKVSIVNGTETIDLFFINPYFKSIILIEDTQRLELVEELNTFYNYQDEIVAELNKVQKAKTNPDEYTKNNLGLYAKSILNKKGFEKGLDTEFNELQVSLLEVKKKIHNLETDLNIYDDSMSDIYILKERFLQILETKLNFKIMKD